MSDRDHSLIALNEFLDYLSSKHLLNKNTAQSRRAAANKVFSVLDAHEASDLRRLDLDQVFRRFENKCGKDYKPNSLMVYRSRVGSTLSDFLAYTENPAQFRPSVKSNGAGTGKKPAKVARRLEDEPEQEPRARTQDQADSKPAPVHTRGLNVPVPLREGVTVQISGLPADLTEAEASRLAAIMKAYAVL